MQRRHSRPFLRGHSMPGRVGDAYSVLRLHANRLCVSMYIFHSLSFLWPGFNTRVWPSNSKDFYLADHTLPAHPEPAWQKMAQSPLNDTTQPVDSEEESQVQPRTDDG